MEKETLEEVAKRLLPNRNGFTNRDRFNFIEGAVYKEIEIDALKKEIELLKHQQEQDKNKHSEEEVLELLQKRTDYVLNPNTFLSDVKKWFEQFKKR